MEARISGISLSLPNRSLGWALMHIKYSSRWAFDRGEEKLLVAMHAADALEAAASQGKLAVWGRRQLHSAYEEIAHTYWQTAQLRRMSLFGDVDDGRILRTEAKTVSTDFVRYEAILVSEAELLAAFPRTGVLTRCRRLAVDASSVASG